MATARATSRPPRDLVDNLPERSYLFLEHLLGSGEVSPYRSHTGDHRSFLVIAGRVRLDFLDEIGSIRSLYYARLQGWHALPGSVYRFASDTSTETTVLEAGTEHGWTAEGSRPERLGPGLGGQACPELSSYTVSKPWGHEVWYTENLVDPRYALKQIHMRAGQQSSLQSHQYKTETNYVIEGEATVLNGAPAPDDPTTPIDVLRLPRAVHQARSGWSSPPGVLHRVIARSEYTSVEVSTPELDDVIRWADDTGRASGWIDTEHVRSRW